MTRSTPKLAVIATLATLPGLAAGTLPVHAATTHKYVGSEAEMRWGTVQVTISVKSKKITDVKTAYSVHTSRSEFITGNALPILRSEVLQAQSADIDGVSRATDTSEAFVESLQSAITRAQKHKTLK